MDRVVGACIGEDEVAHHPHRAGERVDSGRKPPRERAGDVHVAVRGHDHRLVQRDPQVHEVAVPPGGPGGVLAELAHGSGVEPAAALELGKGIVGPASRERGAGGERIVQPQRRGEVVKGHHRLEAALPQGAQLGCVVAYGSAVGQAVELARRGCAGGGAREDAAPLDREAEGVGPEATPGQRGIAAVLAPVAGSALDEIAALAARVDVGLVVRPRPPVAARILVRGAAARLGLEPGDRRAPQEAAREVPRLGGGGGGGEGREDG